MLCRWGGAAVLFASVTVLSASEPVQAAYEVRHQLLVNVPSGTRHLRVWFPMPASGPDQTIEQFRVLAPGPHRRVLDDFGNRQVYFEVQAPDQETYLITQTYRLLRTEQITGLHPEFTRALNEEEHALLAPYLASSPSIVVDDKMRQLACEIVGKEENITLAARKLYTWLLANAEYWIKYPERYAPSGVGSAEYCLDTGAGDGVDLHTLWVSLARAAGIPSRMVFGVLLKKDLDRTEVDQGSRCWAEFYVPGYGWVPMDVVMGDLFADPFPLHDRNAGQVRLATVDGYRGPSPEMVAYYLGNLDARRLVLSRGRDLLLYPPPAAGRINYLAKAHVEADGKVLKEKASWTRTLTYRQRKSK